MPQLPVIRNSIKKLAITRHETDHKAFGLSLQPVGILMGIKTGGNVVTFPERQGRD